MRANRRVWSTIVETVVAVTGALLQPAAAGASQGPPPQVRVNQVGYPSAGPKAAYAMLPWKVARVRFEVVTPYGVVYRGTSARDVGSWNSAYRAVYQLGFSGVQLPGQYRIRLLSPAAAVSPGFIIGDGTQLYRELVDNSVKYRPVFPAATPGQKVSPNLAGRFAADFALGAQLKGAGEVGGGSDADSAAHLLSRARSVYAMAKTTHVGQLVTVFPHDFYPATQWKSDMLWGAAEIALADEAAGAPAARVRADLATAARWARAYIAQGHDDTFNLYDTGAVAEAELIQAMRQAGAFPIAPTTLLADMAAQLRAGQAQAKGDPFALGTQLGGSDASPHAFGLYITDALYQKYGGSRRYASFAQQQLNFALGANGWGTTFVVGAGTVYPHCMQSEIANLAGSLTGRGDIQLGATTDGPSSPDNFVRLGTVDGMRACSAGHFAPFNTKSAAYEDNVVAWPSVEPADDYTANSLMAFALGADQGSGLG